MTLQLHWRSTNMRLNELIKILFEIQNEYGDIDVCVIDNDASDDNIVALDIKGMQIFDGEDIDDIEDVLAIFVEYDKASIELNNNYDNSWED